MAVEMLQFSTSASFLKEMYPKNNLFGTLEGVEIKNKNPQ